MNKIQITNVQLCTQFLISICKIIPSCKFTITNKDCKVNAVSENNVCRAYFETDCIVANDIDDGDFIEFSFNNLINLIKSLKLINNIEDKNECELKFNGYALSYKDDVKFKLNTCKPELVERFYTENINTELTEEFSFITSTDEVKKLLSCISIASEEEEDSIKIYLEQKENSDLVIGEVNDHLNSYSNSVGIPLGNLINKTVINDIICMRVQALRTFTLIDSDVIKVQKCNYPVLAINSEIKQDIGYIKLYSIIQLLKQ